MITKAFSVTFPSSREIQSASPSLFQIPPSAMANRNTIFLYLTPYLIFDLGGKSLGVKEPPDLTGSFSMSILLPKQTTAIIFYHSCVVIRNNKRKIATAYKQPTT